MNLDFDGEKYKQASSQQRALGQKLISELDLKGTERILDLGCGNGAFSDQNFVKELGEITELVMDGNYQANPTSSLAQKMFGHYQALHGTKIAPSAIFAYEAIYVIADAVERAQSRDREAIRDALSKTDIKNHVLPQGPIIFGADGQNKNAQAATLNGLGPYKVKSSIQVKN